MTDEIDAAALVDDEARILRASEAIRHMADDLRPAARRLELVPQRIVDEICSTTRQAPLQSLAIAFLLGVLIVRRR